MEQTFAQAPRVNISYLVRAGVDPGSFDRWWEEGRGSKPGRTKLLAERDEWSSEGTA